MVFSDSTWQECIDTARSTGSYIVFYQGGPIYHCTHVTGQVSQYSAKNNYNTAYTAGMELENSIMQNNEFMNNHAYVVPEQAHLIILNSK